MADVTPPPLIRPDLIKGKYGSASNLAFNERIKLLMKQGQMIYHFGFGQAPFPVLEVAVEALKKHTKESAYLAVQGIPELRQGICDFHKHYDGITFDPENIIVGPGSKELIFLLLLIFNGDILLNSPSWTSYKAQAILTQHTPFVIDSREEDDWRITPEGLEKVITENSLSHYKLLIMTNPCNPKIVVDVVGQTEKPVSKSYKKQMKTIHWLQKTNLSGTCYSEQHLKELTPLTVVTAAMGVHAPCDIFGCLVYEKKTEPNGIGPSVLKEVFRRHNIIVLSDEIYARLHYSENHALLSKVYPEGTILSTGLSKWASAGGWRLGYNIYPKELSSLLSTVSSAASHSYSCAPSPMQFAFAEVLRNLPACDEYIKHTTRVMKAVGQFCSRELRSAGVSVVEPTAGYYIFPNFEVIRPALQKRGILTCQGMCDLMLSDISVAVMPGGPAHLRPDDEFTARLCFVNFDGAEPLAESRKRGLESELDDSFVKDFCSPVFTGIIVLKNWVFKMQEDLQEETAI